eukprot:TRINITY_DN24800_c0_g1_i6.p1 TRINITY_DN24800_c0_g1~~TRINITY_DN24800_c0_g1_i6.p1  ORF type:complete len:376 (+),score=60.25 TRINITY_DN24800_c0_g1_i6:96-1223(+)
MAAVAGYTAMPASEIDSQMSLPVKEVGSGRNMSLQATSSAEERRPSMVGGSPTIGGGLDHRERVRKLVDDILQEKFDQGEPLPNTFYMPFTQSRTGAWNFDEASISTVRPVAAGEDSFYPGYVLLERRSEPVWCGKIQKFAQDAAAKLASMQADVVYGANLYMMKDVPKLIVYTYLAALAVSQVLGICLAAKAAANRYAHEVVGTALSSKVEYSAGFYPVMFLTFLSVSGDLVDTPGDMGFQDKNYGMVGPEGAGLKAPLISLGNASVRPYMQDPHFISRLPSAVLQEGVCFGLQIYVTYTYAHIGGLEAATIVALVTSIIMFIKDVWRAITWIHAFRLCRKYHERRMVDERQPEAPKHASERKLSEMRDQCPIL